MPGWAGAEFAGMLRTSSTQCGLEASPSRGRAKRDATYLALPRSRVNGFDYRASSNTIVFLQQDFSNPPYEIVVSYQRWVTGVVPPD